MVEDSNEPAVREVFAQIEAVWSRLAARCPPGPPQTLVTSIPKAGTHLLVPLVSELLGHTPVLAPKPGVAVPEEEFLEVLEDLGAPLFKGHIRRPAGNYDPTRLRVIVLIRDPRDILLSMRDYLLRSQVPEHLAVSTYLRSLAPEAQLKQLVDGLKVPEFDVPSLRLHCSGFVEWADGGATLVRYEDLLSGAAAEPLAASLGVDPNRLDAVLTRLRGASSPTLHVGRADRWRDVLSPELLDYIAERAPGLIRRLGYQEA